LVCMLESQGSYHLNLGKTPHLFEMITYSWGSHVIF
jgi:hypothetical protein